MKKILLAFQFLTIIPVKQMANVSEKEIAQSSAFFPLAGLFQGILLVCGYGLSSMFFPSDLTTGILLLLLVLSNGGFHLDGLADTFDAIASRKNREEKLAIMKDSTIGPIGVIVIITALLLKFSALNSLYNYSLFTVLGSLFLMPVFARWAMVAAIFHARSARQDGLGKIFIENTKLRELMTATFFTLLISLSLSFTVNKISGYSPHFLTVSLQFLLVLPVLYFFSIVSVWFSNKAFSGMTGDTFGAVSEISEILFLIMVLAWS